MNENDPYDSNDTTGTHFCVLFFWRRAQQSRSSRRRRRTFLASCRPAGDHPASWSARF